MINEYDCIWLHRDGRPTLLGQNFYDRLLGPNATPEQRFELCGYTLAELTEFWRSTRRYAGVMYLAYLDADFPVLNCNTCDNFRDVDACNSNHSLMTTWAKRPSRWACASCFIGNPICRMSSEATA